MWQEWSFDLEWSNLWSNEFGNSLWFWYSTEHSWNKRRFSTAFEDDLASFMKSDRYLVWHFSQIHSQLIRWTYIVICYDSYQHRMDYYFGVTYMHMAKSYGRLRMYSFTSWEQIAVHFGYGPLFQSCPWPEALPPYTKCTAICSQLIKQSILNVHSQEVLHGLKLDDFVS